MNKCIVLYCYLHIQVPIRKCIAYYKIFVVNLSLKLSSNEPMERDCNKIIVNKILSRTPPKSFLNENNFCFKKLVAISVAPSIHCSILSKGLTAVLIINLQFIITTSIIYFSTIACTPTVFEHNSTISMVCKRRSRAV